MTAIPTTMNNIHITKKKAPKSSRYAMKMAKGMSGPYQLEKHDVCCGRGKGYWNHPGNQAFQKIVQANAHRYGQTTSKADKSRLVDTIVKSIFGSGGRFLRQDAASGLWFDIGETMAKDKTGHAIRDHLLNLKKNQAKKAIKKTKPATKKQASRSKKQAAARADTPTLEQEQQQPQEFQQQQTPAPAAPRSSSDSRRQSASQSLDKCFERMPLSSLKIPTFTMSSSHCLDMDQSDQVRKMIDTIVQDEAYKNLSKEVNPSDLSEQEVLEVCELLSEENDDDEIRPIPFMNNFDVTSCTAHNNVFDSNIISSYANCSSNNNLFNFNGTANIMPTDWLRLKLL